MEPFADKPFWISIGLAGILLWVWTWYWAACERKEIMGWFDKRANEEQGEFSVTKVGTGSITIPLTFQPHRVEVAFADDDNGAYPACTPLVKGDSLQTVIQGKAILVSWNICEPCVIRWKAS